MCVYLVLHSFITQVGLCCCWMTLAFGGCLLHSFSVAIDDHSQRAEHFLVLLWSSCPFIATPTSLPLTPIPDPWQPLIYSLWLTVHLPWQVDEQIHACYAQTMSEWLGCEAIVRQRERESHAAALAKCSSGASLDSHLHQMMHRDSTISNEVTGCSQGSQVEGRGWDLLQGAVAGRVRGLGVLAQT